MYLLKEPIFILGMTRGGTNILFNLILSHPNVCALTGELQEIYKSRLNDNLYEKIFKKIRYLPLCLLEGNDVFSKENWERRNRISKITRKLLDRRLYFDRFKAFGETQNFYKSKDKKYEIIEIKNARIVCKLMNGNIFLVDNFYEVYPDVKFVSIIRNGYAVCEGHLRRGENLKNIAECYKSFCEQLIFYKNKIDRILIIKYEDIISEPQRKLKEIYKFLDLNLDDVEAFRLETKKVLNEKGNHKHIMGAQRKKIIWYDIDNFYNHFVKDTNQNQIKNLSNKNIKTISKICGNTLKYFGYEFL